MMKKLLSLVLTLAMAVSLLAGLTVTVGATDSAASDKTVLSSTKIGSSMGNLFANTTTYNKDFSDADVQSIGFIRSSTVPEGYTVVTGAEGSDYAGAPFQFQEEGGAPIYLAYKLNGSKYDVVFYSEGTIYSPATFIDVGGLTALTTVTFDNFNTSEVTDLGSAFSGCTALETLDLSGWDTSKVTVFSNMFKNCRALAELDLSNFDTSSATAMLAMFSGCQSLTELDLSNFDTSSVTAAGVQQLLKGCTGLKFVDLSGLDLTSKTNFADMIDDCTNLLALVTPAKMPTGTNTSIKLPTTASFYYNNGANSTNKLDKYVPTGTLLSRRYAVEFEPGNDATLSPSYCYYYYGQGLDSLPVPEPSEGFVGWLLDGEPITSISATQTGNLTLVGDWEEDSSSQTYNWSELKHGDILKPGDKIYNDNSDNAVELNILDKNHLFYNVINERVEYTMLDSYVDNDLDDDGVEDDAGSYTITATTWTVMVDGEGNKQVVKTEDARCYELLDAPTVSPNEDGKYTVTFTDKEEGFEYYVLLMADLYEEAFAALEYGMDPFNVAEWADSEFQYIDVLNTYTFPYTVCQTMSIPEADGVYVIDITNTTSFEYPSSFVGVILKVENVNGNVAGKENPHLVKGAVCFGTPRIARDLTAEIENGSIAFSSYPPNESQPALTEGKELDMIFMQIIPEEGYRVESYEIIAENGESVLAEAGSNAALFIMPRSAVTVNAVLAEGREPITWNLSDLIEGDSEALATPVKPGDIIVNDLSEETWFYVADRYYDDVVELNSGESWTVPTEFTMEKYDFENDEYFTYTIESNSYTWMTDEENYLWLVKTADAKPIEPIEVETAQNENGKFTVTFEQEEGFVYFYAPMEDLYEEGIKAEEFISTFLPEFNAMFSTSRQTVDSLDMDELGEAVIVVTNGSFEVDSSILGILYKIQKVDDVTGISNAYLIVGGAMVVGGRIARDVTVAATENGTVTATVTTAKELDIVSLTVTPAEGYMLESLTVTDAEGNPVVLEDGNFVMPKSAVTVTAVFAQASSAESDTIENLGASIIKIEDGKVVIDETSEKYDAEAEYFLMSLPASSLPFLNMDADQFIGGELLPVGQSIVDVTALNLATDYDAFIAHATARTVLLMNEDWVNDPISLSEDIIVIVYEVKATNKAYHDFGSGADNPYFDHEAQMGIDGSVYAYGLYGVYATLLEAPDSGDNNKVNNVTVDIDWDKIAYNNEGYPELNANKVILTPDVAGAIDLEYSYFNWVYYDEAEGGEWYTLDFSYLPDNDPMVGIMVYFYPLEGYEFGRNLTVSCEDYEVDVEYCDPYETGIIIKLGNMNTALSGIKPYTPPTLSAVDATFYQDPFGDIVNGERLPDLERLVDMGVLSGTFKDENGDTSRAFYQIAKWMYAPIGTENLQEADYDHVADTDANVYMIKITLLTGTEYLIPDAAALADSINITGEDGQVYAKHSYEFVRFEGAQNPNAIVAIILPAADEPIDPPTPPAPPVVPEEGNTTPPAINIPVSNDKNSVNASADVSGNVAMVKPLDKNQIDQLVGNKNASGDVVIDLSNLDRYIDTAGIPKETMEAILAAAEDAGNDTEHLVIKLSTAELKLNDAAMRAIVDQSKSDLIRFNFDDVGLSRMNAAQKNAVKSLNVRKGFEAYITVNGARISDFRGGEIEITVPYVIPAGEKVSGFSVWYIDEEGNPEKLKSTYDGKEKCFVVTHFSDYVIVYDEEDAVCPKDETCPIHGFSDSDAQEWYHDGVHYCLVNGLMVGMPENLFAPNDATTRAQVIAILWRLEGEPVVNYNMTFQDVEDNAWYTEAIRWAQSVGIIEGYSAKKCGPNNAVTREQMATILWRYCKYKGIDVSVSMDTNILSYEDAFNVSDWAMEAMQWACGSGMIQGIDKNGVLYLDPQEKAVRSQCATMIHYLCEEIVK